MVRLPKYRPPVTPGELLRDTIESMEISQLELARRTQMPVQRINDIINRGRRMTASTALRLEKVLGISAGFWMNAQQAVDLYDAQRKEAAVLSSLAAFATP